MAGISLYTSDPGLNSILLMHTTISISTKHVLKGAFSPYLEKAELGEPDLHASADGSPITARPDPTLYWALSCDHLWIRAIHQVVAIGAHRRID